MSAREKSFCYYPGCATVLGEGLSLFRFPNKTSNAEMFKKWIEAIGRADISKDDDFRYRKICQAHFSPGEYKKSLQNKNILTKKAVPKCNDQTKPIDESFLQTERKRKLFQIEQNLRKDKRYGCKYCDREFKTPQCKTAHENQIHLKIEPKPDAFKCRYCDKTFKFHSTRTSHISSQHTQRVKCEICEKTFSSRNLKLHYQNAHSDLKPISCNFCDKSFKQDVLRRRHELRLHSKEIISLSKKVQEKKERLNEALKNGDCGTVNTQNDEKTSP